MCCTVTDSAPSLAATAAPKGLMVKYPEKERGGKGLIVTCLPYKNIEQTLLKLLADHNYYMVVKNFIDHKKFMYQIFDEDVIWVGVV